MVKLKENLKSIINKGKYIKKKNENLRTREIFDKLKEIRMLGKEKKKKTDCNV